MNALESTVALAFASALTLGTLELAEKVELKANTYNDAVKTQTDCYKKRDFKCSEAVDKFKKVNDL